MVFFWPKKRQKRLGGTNCIIQLELILKVTCYTVDLKKDAVAPFILDSTSNPFRNRLSCLSQLTNHPHRCWASLPGKLHQGPHLETSLALGSEPKPVTLTSDFSRSDEWMWTISSDFILIMYTSIYIYIYMCVYHIYPSEHRAKTALSI